MRNYGIFFIALLVAACTQVQPTAESETILVGGATGRQGGAVVAELLERGYRVRALTRDPASERAQALAALGVEVVAGNYADVASLDAALKGIRKVFFYSGRSPNELDEGRNVIAAAQRAGVEHLVYSSGAAAEPGRGLPSPKMDVELAIVASGLHYTVLRPVAFMENFERQQKRVARIGVSDSRAPERMLHFIAVRDIGFFAGEAFDDPDTWLDVATNIAGDRMTVAQHVEVLSAVMGQPVEFTRVPLEQFLNAMPKPLRPLFRWYDEVGYAADVDLFRARYPQLTTLEQYLRQTGWSSPQG